MHNVWVIRTARVERMNVVHVWVRVVEKQLTSCVFLRHVSASVSFKHHKRSKFSDENHKWKIQFNSRREMDTVCLSRVHL